MLTFERWKITLVLVIALLGIVYAAPNFLARGTAESLPGWIPHKQINLGLDLQGGSHLLLEVDVATVLAEQLEAEGYAGVLGDAAVDEPETMVGLPHVADFGEDPFADPLA